ncbi:MAG: GAF domain-containing protein [Magnetococcales bacterium]|nr:GAF domain-containing protein [Magnetococcales bacterium]
MSEPGKTESPPRRQPSASVVAAKRRLRHLELLLDLSKEVAAQDELDAMLRIMVDAIVLEIDCERGSIFLNDENTGELYTRYAQGQFKREIRILNNRGVAGYVFQNQEGIIIHDAYEDDRFDSSVDKETGFTTRNILCVPLRTPKGAVIGVVQALNKKKGRFVQDDLKLLEALTIQTAVTLQGAQAMEKMRRDREKELEFLNIVSDLTSEIDIDRLLQKVMKEATEMLKADRGTLFLNDARTNELFSRVAMGSTMGEIRLPNSAGIAGAVFTSGKTINIPYAYADLRFNPAFDKKTGYFTRSILCVPIANKDGRTIGVTQVLNKKGGVFSEEDESRLRAFTAQVSIALENAKLFDDIQNIKNYNESMLESMSNGVITIGADGVIVTCNAAGLRLLESEPKHILKRPAKDFFEADNAWVLARLETLRESGQADSLMDAELRVGGKTLSVNVTFLPLVSGDGKSLGSMILIEDISSEKRMKSTMSRYMDPGLAAQIMAGGEDLLGGKSIEATVLFSDIRSFTTLTETLGAQGTVALLNEYFTLMVECIQNEGGMLDKFIGDAMMAGFGLPLPHGDDEDRAVRAAIAMINALKQLNMVRVGRGEMEIKMGIGLNTGTVVSGNIGSPKRMDYTMIGDDVNLASRLESACKQYHAQILISANTYDKLKGTYRLREVDLVVVKGKTRPVAIYEVLDYHNAASFPNLMPVVNHFTSGLNYYREGRFPESIGSFGEALKLHPGDLLSRTYIGRCEALIKNPPGDKWDGVWVMQSK